MNSVTAKDLQRGTVCASVTDLLTRKSQQLTTKRDSRCLFFETFDLSNYRIQLRLDWGDLDEYGNPRMDADFYDPLTGKIDKSMKAHPAHQTTAQESEPRLYVWKFKDESRSLQVALSWTDSVSLAANAQFCCAAEVIHSEKAVDPEE
jgi:hypothetical protein